MVIIPEKPNELLHLLKSEPLILYGMGYAGKRIAKWCDEHEVLYMWSDKNAEILKNGVPDETVIVTPWTIPVKYPTANIVVASLLHSKEITEDLLSIGVKIERIIQPDVFIPDTVTWRIMEDTGSTDWEKMYDRANMLVKWGWIPCDVKSVADYGCGRMFIKEFLSDTVTYYPIDYIDRSGNTIICDFNKLEFPSIDSELSLCMGVLMFIEPMEELVDHICSHTQHSVVISYITTESWPDIHIRHKSGMCQNHTEQQIIDMFAERNYGLKSKKYDDTDMTFFLFERIGERK